MITEEAKAAITGNYNPGVEYEIALFIALTINDDEKAQLLKMIKSRDDYVKILSIYGSIDKEDILNELKERELTLLDISLETQNDDIGPADIVMKCADSNGEHQIGLSVKYSNRCTLNVTGMRFITEAQRDSLEELLPKYAKRYINEMTELYGDSSNWFRRRKQSKVTEEFIDLIRDAVIDNWNNIQDKSTLFSSLYHSDSPIEYWVVTFNRDDSIDLDTCPMKIDLSRVDDIQVGKMGTSFVAFYLDGEQIGHMQVKFNNGFLERNNGLRYDVLYEGIEMKYGKPFGSWNFNIEKRR